MRIAYLRGDVFAGGQRDGSSLWAMMSPAPAPVPPTSALPLGMNTPTCCVEEVMAVAPFACGPRILPVIVGCAATSLTKMPISLLPEMTFSD